MPTVTLTATGVQKIAGLYGNGNGATYVTTVTAGTATVKKFDVRRRPIRGGSANVVGSAGNTQTVTYTENARFDFEMEVWVDVSVAGTVVVTQTASGETDRIYMLTSDSIGLVTGLSTTNSAAAATANTTAIQANLTAAGLVQITAPGPYYTTDSLLFPCDTSLYLGPGVYLTAFAASNRSMFRTSNVRMTYDGAAVALVGFQVLYADTATSAGTGTLTYATSGTTLTWTAPGDTAGTPVNVGTGGFYRIASGTAGKAIYVLSPNTGKPSGNVSQSIYVSTIKGAVICSAAVTSNEATVTETAHGREVGDTLEIYRPSTEAVIVSEIATVTSANTYTLTWTVTDFTSEAIAVHGVRNIGIYGPGIIDQQESTITNGSTVERFVGYFQNCSKITFDNFTFKNGEGRGFGLRNSSDHKMTNLWSMNIQNLLSYEGPANRIGISNIHGYSNSNDDIVAFTCTSLTAAASYNYTGTAVMGAIQNVDITGIFAEGSGCACALKLTGFTGSSFDAINVRGLYGVGYSAACLFVDDGASLVGATIGTIRVSDVDWRAVGGVNVGEICNFTISGGGGTLKFSDCTWNGTSTQGIRMVGGALANAIFNEFTSANSPTTAMVSIGAQTVTRLEVNECDLVLGAAGQVVNLSSASTTVTSLSVNGGSWTGNSGAYGVHQNDGTLTNLHIGGGLYAATIRNIFESETAADNAVNILIGAVTQNGTGNGIVIREETGATVNVAGPWRLASVAGSVIADVASMTGTVTANLQGVIDTTTNLFAGTGTARAVRGLNFTQTPAHSATPTFTLSRGNKVVPGVMTAAITAITLADVPPAGERGSFVFTQNGTGGFNITMPSTIKFPTAAYTNTGNTANTKTVIDWVSDGTNLIAQGTNAWN